MIETKKGDLLSVTEGIIVHGCNAQGVMGSGVARLIRDKYPAAYDAYRTAYEDYLERGFKALPIGMNIYYRSGPLVIVNAVTQEFYGRDASTVYVDYQALAQCFLSLNQFLIDNSADVVGDVNFPLIGCGLANGDWNIVSDIIDRSITNRIKKVLWVQ